MKKLGFILILISFTVVKGFSQNPDTFNKWFQKTTGSNYKFDFNQIKFDTKNYDNALFKFPNFKYDLEDVTGDNLSNLRPNVISNNGSIKIVFMGGWSFTIFANANYYIMSVHHGSSGDAQIFNLKTGVLENVDFEIFELNGDKAQIHTSWHENGGRYVSRNGIYDLNTKKLKYGKKNYY